jgi:hypothetical protein
MADKLKARYLSDAVAMIENTWPTPTPANGLGANVSAWSRTDDGEQVSVPEVEVTILGAGDVELADGAYIVAEEIHTHYAEESIAVTFTNGTEIVNLTDHGFYTGDGPIRFTATTMPTGLSAAVQYWVIRVTSGTFQVAETRALALAGTEKTFSTDGTLPFVHWVTGTKSTSQSITSVDATANTFTKVGHGLTANQVVQLSTTTTLPASLAVDADYYVIVTSSSVFQLSLTSNGAAYNITDIGTGDHSVISNSLAATSETVFLKFLELNEGYAISLEADIGYRERFTHRPGVVAYHLVATEDAPVPLTAYVRAVSEE